MPSYWDVTSSNEIITERATDGTSVAADVVVVGGGFTGLSAAYHLAGLGVRVVLLEEKYVGYGASGRNGGQVLSGWPVGMVDVARRFGLSVAESLWSISEEALQRIETLTLQEGIDCDLKAVGHLEAAHSKRAAARLQHELGLVQGWTDRTLTWWDRDTIGAKVGTLAYPGGLFDPGSKAFHPLNYALGLGRACMRRGVIIYQGVRVTGVEASALTTPRFRIDTQVGVTFSAETVVLATNAYSPGFAHWLRPRILPVHSAQIAFKVDERVMPPSIPTVSDTRVELNYYRRVADQYVLFGGRALSSELKHLQFDSLLRQFQQLFPEIGTVTVTHQWAGPVALTRDFIPHLNQMPDGIWFAGGYTGHGAALSTEMGFLIAEALYHDRPDERVTTLLDIPMRRFPFSRVARFVMPSILQVLDWGQRRLLGGR